MSTIQSGQSSPQITDKRPHDSLPESPRYSLLKGRREQARLTLDKSYGNMSARYIDLKFAALEENVAISARLVNSTTAAQRWKMVLTHGPYRRPAITALGIGIFQQLCGFNTLSEHGCNAHKFRMSGLTIHSNSVLLGDHLLYGWVR